MCVKAVTGRRVIRGLDAALASRLPKIRIYHGRTESLTLQNVPIAAPRGA